MAVQPKLDTSLELETDIQKIRRIFDDKISAIYVDNSEWRRMETREWVDNAIRTIESYNLNPSKDWSLSEQELVKTYEVDEIGGKKIIRIKAARLSLNKRLRLVPMEDYFEVLYEAHILTEHAQHDELIKHLIENQIYMPSSAVMWFVKLCRVCQLRRLRKAQTKHLTDEARNGYIELFDMTDRPDGIYNYIMCYIDLSTEHTYLRPLSTNKTDEVALVLYRLFSEGACPAVLHSPTTDGFTAELIQKLKSHLPQLNLAIGEQMKKTIEIQDALLKWTQTYRSNVWSLGIYVLAYDLNIRKTVHIHREIHKPLNLYVVDKGLKTASNNTASVDEKQNIIKDDFFISRAIGFMVYEGKTTEKIDGRRTKYKQNVTELTEGSNVKDKQENAPDIETKDDTFNNTLEVIFNKNPEDFDNSLPGPSTSQAFFNKIYVKPEEPKEDDSLQVKHFPIKTYSRKKFKADDNTGDSKNTTEVSQLDTNTCAKTTNPNTEKPKTQSSQMVLRKRKHIETASASKTKTEKETTKKQATTVNKEHVSKKAICVNKNLKYVNAEEYCTSRIKLKEVRSWTSDVIDLPANPVEYSNTACVNNSISLNLNELMLQQELKAISSDEDIKYIVKDTGKEMTGKLSASEDKMGGCSSSDVDLPIDTDPKPDDNQSFGVIVKIESFTENADCDTN